jgi:chromate transporter
MLAILVQAVIEIGSRAKNHVMVGLAAAAFIAIFFFQAPFPLIIITTAIVSYLDGRVWSNTF